VVLVWIPRREPQDLGTAMALLKPEDGHSCRAPSWTDESFGTSSAHATAVLVERDGTGWTAPEM